MGNIVPNTFKIIFFIKGETTTTKKIYFFHFVVGPLSQLPQFVWDEIL